MLTAVTSPAPPNKPMHEACCLSKNGTILHPTALAQHHWYDTTLTLNSQHTIKHKPPKRISIWAIAH